MNTNRPFQFTKTLSLYWAAFLLFCLITYLLGHAEFILLAFYSPGIALGLAFASFPIEGKLKPILLLLLPAVYFLLLGIYFTPFSGEFYHRVSFGGLSILIALLIVRPMIKFTARDCLIGFVSCTLICIPIWYDHFQNFHPVYTIAAIVLWQLVFGLITDYRYAQITSKKLSKNIYNDNN